MATNNNAIWTGSYGYYNEGMLVGEWVSLPMDSDALQATIRTACKVDAHHEEVGIFDTDFDFDGYQVSQYDSIDSVNALAAAIESADEHQLNAATAYMSMLCDLDALKAANIIMNADDIAYYAYTVDSPLMSDDERLGYSLLEDTDTMRKLEDMGIVGYFDFEGYGRDARLSGDVDAFEDGYMVYSEVDDDTYTASEILEMCGYSATDNDATDESAAA